MSTLRKLVRKAKEHLVEDGLKDTLYIGVHYIRRQWEMRKAKKSDYLELEMSTGDAAHGTLKTDPTVYICAVVPYYDIGGGQRCSQLAKTFNKMGYRVKYLYTSASSDKRDSSILIPAATHACVGEETLRYVGEHVKAEDLFVFEAPVVQFKGLLDLAAERGCRIVYENIDNWETSLGKEFFNEAMLKKILTAAHMLVGTARPLVEQLEQYLDRFQIAGEDKYIAYLANAVDDELFCGALTCGWPGDLVRGTKTFLFYGSLWGEWFDWNLILGLARRHPDYAINLIGNADGIKRMAEQCPDNVHFLGLKAQKELPAYLQYVDYTLLPFKRGEIGDYVSPLKVFEYIAMYTRVLSTSLPDIQGYPNVYIGDTVEEWEAVIGDDRSVDTEAADAFTDNNTWTSRVSEMIRCLYPGQQSLLQDKLAIVILNYNNKKVIVKCVNSLLRYRDYYGYEIVVVDNGSTDGSYELLQERYSAGQIKLCRNVKNGCSSGRNLGVEQTEREYVMFLDSDQWATGRYWLRAYEEIMKKYPDFGAIGWAAGYFNSSGGACYTVDAFPHRNMPPQLLCRNDIGYLGSGGLLMPVDLFREMGGFDTYYDPTCYEDTDISLKVRDCGREIYYCPHLGVIHLPHQTTNAGSEAHKNLIRQKKEYFVEKWKKKNPKLLEYQW